MKTAVVFLSAAVLAVAADHAGKASYDKACKSCHGADGAGNPAIAKMMKVELKALAGVSAADTKKAIAEGKGKMKPVPSVSGKAADDVAAYIGTFKK